MYRNDTSGGCGCGGSSAGGVRTGSSRARTTQGRTLGRIDERGQCVCGDCDPCDGLTCLCRPRFFDGQLVTAADFRRLDQYIVAKSRLHNRYLHGVGVVCGLEVVCSPCDDDVTVRTGYALGPCGEDIVVCSDAKVDVAALIKEQRASVARSDCSPYTEASHDLEAARQKWVLGVCYDEHAARPVTSLKRASSGCGGSCSGSCGGSCGCGGSGASVTTPSSCEPTQVCEGFRFTLTKLAPSKTDGKSFDGELPRLVMACLERLRDGITSLPEKPSNDELVDYAHQLKDELRELLETGNVHDCTLGQRLFDIAIPDPGDADADVRARAAVTAMLQLTVDLFRDCVCSALLPQCGDGCADDCVPLAVITVRSSDLRVLDICNWSARKFVITMPTLQYWLGWVPIFGALRDAIARLCCGQARRPRFEVDPQLRFKAAATAAPPAGAPAGAPAAAPAADEAFTRRATVPTEPAAFGALASQYRETWSSLSGLEATVLGALGARTSKGQPLASELELDNPLAALTLGHLGVDAGATVLPPAVARRIAEAEPDRIAVLEQSLEKLRKTVDGQARTIRTLKAKGPGQ